jgi:hypothetical protein
VTWALVLLLVALYVAVMLRVAYWVGGVLADAEDFRRRAVAGECTCTRHRLCVRCLEELRLDREREEAAA